MKTPSTAIGESPLYLEALDRASQLANLDRPVLILGERGSGKELIAHRMHFLSPRWDEPFIKINCAALTETLVESALFGHEAGAFTGASKTQTGYFERVGQGTLFLDEIATLSLRIQEKLLRVLEYGEFERLGGQKTLETQGRILGATHGNLKALADNGQFRHDLLDRLAFDVVHMPPLRLRDHDVLRLAEHFAVAFISQTQQSYFAGFTERAEAQLLSYSWPGNVRELKNVVERSLFRAANKEEPLDELALDPFCPPWQTHEATAEQPLVINKEDNEEPAQQPLEEPGPFDFKQARESWERQQVNAALAACQHHQGRTASFMGLSYDQFRALLKRLDPLDRP